MILGIRILVRLGLADFSKINGPFELYDVATNNAPKRQWRDTFTLDLFKRMCDPSLIYSLAFIPQAY